MNVENVVSLFDGMSNGQIALNRAGFKIKNYFASEIDKPAIKVTMANFPNTIQLGDVTKLDTSALPKIDLLLGGSPCQSFSFAGKRKGMVTKDLVEILSLEDYLKLKDEYYEFEGQSYLFWEYMRILEELRKVNPEIKFLLENVVMTEKWENVLSNAIGVRPIKINSALVSAQNRRRLYWFNFGLEPGGLFGELMSVVEQPQDKGILLRDILEEEVDKKYYLSDKMLNYFDKRADNFNNGKVNIRSEKGKATTLTKSMGSCDISDNFIKQPVVNQNGELRETEKSTCIDANYYKGMDNHSQRTMIAQKESLVQIGSLYENNAQAGRIYTSNGKSTTLNSQSGGVGAKTGLYQVNILNDNQQKKFNPDKEADKSGCLTEAQGRGGSSSEYMDSVSKVSKLTGTIRRLTPIECERLQTVPDNYTNHVSDTQRYKMLGNGWTVDVIVHILNYLK